MYKFKLKNQKTGYKGKTYTDDNINKLPAAILTGLEKSGVLVKIKEEKKKTEK